MRQTWIEVADLSSPQIALTTFPNRISEAVSVFVQHEVDEIEKDLAKFNEQINQIENSGRQDPTIELLKEQAILLARHIDELRCSLCAKN